MAHPVLDGRAWMVWLLAGVLSLFWLRNPLYTGLILLAAWTLTLYWPAETQTPPLPLGRVGGVMLSLTTLWNVLLVHQGESIIGYIPDAWPLVGGPLTLEAAAQGAINGLMLWALLALFVVFNRMVAPEELIRLAPPAWRDVSVVLVIALTYVPETMRHMERIREAQAIRGHRLRGWRDWRPLVIPLLVGGLERALNLAEALMARGYGRPAVASHGRRLRLLLVAALGLSLSGWVVRWWLPGWGWLGLAGGLALVGTAIWLAGRETTTTRYRPRPWQRPSTWLVVVSVGVAVASYLGREAAFYSPYPRLSLPPFAPGLGLALLALTAPLWRRSPPGRHLDAAPSHGAPVASQHFDEPPPPTKHTEVARD